jgi:hypothetical protein
MDGKESIFKNPIEIRREQLLRVAIAERKAKDNETIEKYGDVEMEFSSYHNGHFMYTSKDNRYSVSGYLKDRMSLDKRETVKSFFEKSVDPTFIKVPF